MIAQWVIRPEWEGGDKPGTIKMAADACFQVNLIQYWVPAGYEIDGASIPAPLWYVAGTPFCPENAEPASAHDPLYLTHALSRSDSDEVLYQLKLAYEIRVGTSRWLARFRAWRMWAGVRIGGVFAWTNSAADKTDLEKTKIAISTRPDLDKFKTLWFSTNVAN